MTTARWPGPRGPAPPSRDDPKGPTHVVTCKCASRSLDQSSRGRFLQGPSTQARRIRSSRRAWSVRARARRAYPGGDRSNIAAGGAARGADRGSDRAARSGAAWTCTSARPAPAHRTRRLGARARHRGGRQGGSREGASIGRAPRDRGRAHVRGVRSRHERPTLCRNGRARVLGRRRDDADHRGLSTAAPRPVRGVDGPSRGGIDSPLGFPRHIRRRLGGHSVSERAWCLGRPSRMHDAFPFALSAAAIDEEHFQAWTSPVTSSPTKAGHLLARWRRPLRDSRSTASSRRRQSWP